MSNLTVPLSYRSGKMQSKLSSQELGELSLFLFRMFNEKGGAVMPTVESAFAAVADNVAYKDELIYFALQHWVSGFTFSRGNHPLWTTV